MPLLMMTVHVTLYSLNGGQQLQKNSPWSTDACLPARAACLPAHPAAAWLHHLTETHQCKRLRAELAAAKQEAQTWRAKWDKECINNGSNSSSCPFCNNGASAAAFLSKQYSSVRGSTPAISAISTDSDESGSEAVAMSSVITAGGGQTSPLAAAVPHQLSTAEGVMSAAGGRGTNAAGIGSNSSGRGRDDVSSRRRVFFT